MDFVDQGILNGLCLPLWVNQVAGHDEDALHDEPSTLLEAIEDDDKDDDPTVDGPHYLGEVMLAVKKGVWYGLNLWTS